MKKAILTALTLSAALLPAAQAAVVKVEYQVNIWAKYDASLNRYVQFAPISGLGYFQYDDAFSTISNYGLSTYANFGSSNNYPYYPSYPYGTPTVANKMVSPVSQYLPAGMFDNISTNVSVNMNSYYAYPGPYPTQSSVSVSAYGSKYDSQTMMQYSYNQNISMPIANYDLNGDGVSDFGLVDRIKLFDFWNDNLGSTFAFNESYSAYTSYNGTGPMPSGLRVGESWYGDFSITAVKNIPYEPYYPYPGYPGYLYPEYPYSGYLPSPNMPTVPIGGPVTSTVPEPATILLFGLGLFGFAISRCQAAKRKLV